MKTKITYIAFDGKEFDNNDLCLQHEKNASGEVKKNWDAIPKIAYSDESLPLTGCCSDTHYVIKCRNKEDIDSINMFLSMIDNSESKQLLEYDKIDVRVVITLFDKREGFPYADSYDMLGTVEDVLNTYKQKLYALIINN